MTNFSEAAYWITIAHLPRWGSEKVNKLIVSVLHNNKQTLEEFFNLDTADWKNIYHFNEKEINDLINAKKSLANNSFLAEDLHSQGYEIVTLNSAEYSPTLKANLKAKHSPPILYIKGNKNLLKENSLAIVGSRDATEKSLVFTDNIAKMASEQFKVVVSGFAKGVDKQALDSAIKHIGQSIIVLPQGILTYSAGIKKYYKQIVDGNVLVLSTFHPKSIWSVGLAMARNPIIYGLAKEIFVAQSSNKGGTWEGVKSGLKMGRTIFVREPDSDEKNANYELIKLGATPVDFNGNIIQSMGGQIKEVKSIKADELSEESPLSQIVQVLKTNNIALSASEIKKKLDLKISAQKITVLIKGSDAIQKIKGKPVKYSLINNVLPDSKLNFDENKVPEMKLNEDIKERIEKATLDIASISFSNNDEWKFIYKKKVILAKMSDNEFNNKVYAGKTGFTSKDKLKVELKIIEYSQDIFKYEVIKVIQHDSNLDQLDLNFSN